MKTEIKIEPGPAPRQVYIVPPDAAAHALIRYPDEDRWECSACGDGAADSDFDPDDEPLQHWDACFERYRHSPLALIERMAQADIHEDLIEMKIALNLGRDYILTTLQREDQP